MKPARAWLDAARLLVALAFLVAGVAALPSRPRFPVLSLPALGESVERPLSFGHRYAFHLEKGDFLELAVEQGRADVVLELTRAWRRGRLTLDRPDTLSRPERLLVVAPESGRFELRVAPLGRGGRYRLTTLAKRPAGERDRLRAEAFSAFFDPRAPAVPRFERAVRRFREMGDGEGEALALRELGRSLADLSRPAEAERALRASLAAARAAGTKDQEAFSLRQLARFLDPRMRPEESRAFLVQARDRFQELGLAAEEAEAWNALARLSRDAMDLGAAERGFWAALEIYRRIGDRDGEAGIWINLGFLESQLGDPEIALERFAKYRELIPEPDEEGLARLLEGEGDAFLALERHDEARQAFLRVLKLRRGQPAAERLFAVNALAILEFREERWPAAAERFDELLALTKSPRERVPLLQNLATCLWWGGELERSRDLYEQTLDLARQTEMRHFEAAALGGLARVAFAGRRYDEAWTWVSQALENVERFRDSTPRPELRSALFSSYQELFDLGLDILFARNGGAAWSPWADEALLLCERSRARRLLDILAFSAGESGKARPIGRIEVERELLDGDTAFLELDVNSERAALFLLTREERRWIRFPKEAGIEEKARRLAEALPEAGRKESRHRSQAAAERLSQVLLAPVAEALAGKRRLLIVPDGSLYSIPFTVLRWPEGGPRAGQLLVDTHEVATAPSASTAVLLRRLPPLSDAAKLWLTADPVFEKGDERFLSPDAPASPGVAGATRAVGDLDAKPLVRLAHARKEVEALLARIPRGRSRVALGFEATREQVLRAPPGGAEIVAFITHGEYDPRRPELSWLALSRYDRAGRSIAGYVTALDVRRLSLPADLVVLSACETARGKLLPGEGLLGLSHAFFEAGSRANVVTLWKVDDEATSFLMDSFYEGLLQDRLSPAAALRRAQRALRAAPGKKEWSHPYYWAGFLVQGDGFYTKPAEPGFPSRTPSPPGFRTVPAGTGTTRGESFHARRRDREPAGSPGRHP